VSASLNRQNDFLPFVRDLRKVLESTSVEVIRDRPYRSYMALMEEGHMNLDSYPFGGCNTVVDSLYLRKLTVCREGDVWYNRIGPALLRRVGLNELIATTDEEFIEVVLRLIHDDDFRDRLQARLDRVDLDSTLFDRSEARAFRAAVDLLVENHERFRAQADRSPIRIAAPG
jgi:predicted O-linked N-acetylglucosamine transferase (SPINDLY family)